jgi:SAM-dependent methyltransferase
MNGMMIKKSTMIFRASGLSGLFRAATSRLRGLLAGRAASFSTYQTHFIGKSGIEIGGPSQVFSKRGIFPVYPIAGNLDNCNYRSNTVWGGAAGQGERYRFDPDKPDGKQYIAEATDMGKLLSGTYDFVLSSHVLEHSANPLRALSEWKRLLKDDGYLVLMVPDKKHTFDHRRPVTALAHLIDDFNTGTGEDDLTHLPEILALHDLERDPEAGDTFAFKSRSSKNFENRCLHHHVFDMRLVVALLEHIGLTIMASEELRPHHLLLVAQNGFGGTDLFDTFKAAPAETHRNSLT